MPYFKKQRVISFSNSNLVLLSLAEQGVVVVCVGGGKHLINSDFESTPAVNLHFASEEEPVNIPQKLSREQIPNSVINRPNKSSDASNNFLNQLLHLNDQFIINQIVSILVNDQIIQLNVFDYFGSLLICFINKVEQTYHLTK